MDKQQDKIRKLNQELNMIGGQNMDEDLSRIPDTDMEGGGGDTIEGKRRQLFVQLKSKVGYETWIMTK